MSQPHVSHSMRMALLALMCLSACGYAIATSSSCATGTYAPLSDAPYAVNVDSYPSETHNPHWINQMAFSADEQYLYWAAEAGVHRMRVSDGVRTQLSSGSARGLAVSLDGQYVYFSDFNANKVKRYAVSGGGVSDVADVEEPKGQAISSDGNWLYVQGRRPGEDTRDRILKVSVSNGAISVVDSTMGTGPLIPGNASTGAQFQPRGNIGISPDDKWIYFSEYKNEFGKVRISDGELIQIRKNGVEGLSHDQIEIFAIGPSGRYAYYASHRGDRQVKMLKIDSDELQGIQWLAGGSGDQSTVLDGDPATAMFWEASGIAVNKNGTKLYVADKKLKMRIITIETPEPCLPCELINHCAVAVTCSGPSNSNCSQCEAGYFWNNTHCAKCSSINGCISDILCTNLHDARCDCGPGYYLDSEKMECEGCPFYRTSPPWATSSTHCIPQAMDVSEVFEKENALSVRANIMTMAQVFQLASPEFRAELDLFFLSSGIYYHEAEWLRCWNCSSLPTERLCFDVRGGPIIENK